MSHVSFRSSCRLAAMAALLAVVASSFAGTAGAAPESPADSTQMVAAASGNTDALLGKDMSELLRMEVTTASKKQESWFRSPAAVAVLTAEDIRRSGAETIADALRLVPGMEVARIDGTKWAVSARGFNSRYANKLVVLVDGRSVYTPLFSGVHWDALDLLLDDVERIEVIRGPGATLWGSNAVNGVVNIITKDSQDTQDVVTRASSGSAEHVYGGVRYGGRLGPRATYRAFGMGFERAGFDGPSVNGPLQDWDSQRGGFRVDWNPSNPDEMTLVGHVYSSRAQQFMIVPSLAAPYTSTIEDRVLMRGTDVLGRWAHHSSDRNELTLQSSVSLTDRDEFIGHEKRATVDVDLQNVVGWAASQTAVWGTNYRLTADDLVTPHTVSTVIPRQTDYLVGVFAQNESQLGSAVSLTLGAKLEGSRFSRPSVLPNVRAAWHPNEHQTLWAATSRALRTLGRGERTATLRLAVFPDTTYHLPVAATYVPGGDPHNESVTAFEAGYRVQPVDRVLLDVSAYHNLYRNLALVQPGTTTMAFEGSTPYLLMPLYPVNTAKATGDGIESSLRVAVTPAWQLRAEHTWAQLVYDGGPGAGSLTSASLPARNRGVLQSLLQLPGHLELDAQFHVVGALPTSTVAEYHELFLRAGWRPVAGFEASVSGENLLHRRHMEFPADVNFAPAWVERSVRVSVRYAH